MRTCTLRLLSVLLGIVSFYGIRWIISKLDTTTHEWWELPTALISVGLYLALIFSIVTFNLLLIEKEQSKKYGIRKIKQYVCIGDYVISKSDGDRHYISSKVLMKLYKLSDEIADCIEKKDELMYWHQFNSTSLRPISLRPRYNGRYDLPNNFETEKK